MICMYSNCLLFTGNSYLQENFELTKPVVNCLNRLS